RTEEDRAHSAILLVRVRREVPTQAEIDREVLPHLPVVLPKEPKCCHPVLDVLERRPTGTQVIIDAGFIEYRISRKVKDVQEVVGGTLLRPAEEVVLLITKNLDAGLYRMLSTVQREHVAPVPIILNEHCGCKPVAKSFDQTSPVSVPSVDGRLLTMRTFLVAGEARKAYRSLIDHCGTECVGSVDVCIVGEGFRRECVSECSPQLSASNISGPSLVIDMYPVLGLIEVSI